MDFLEGRFSKVLDGGNVTISGFGEGEKAFFPYFLHQKTLIVAQSVDSLEIFEKVLSSLGKKVITLEDKLPAIISLNESHSKDFKKYILALSAMAMGDYDYVVITPSVLFQKLPSKESLTSRHLHFCIGQRCNVDDLVSSLVQMGYRMQDLVSEKGDFAVRGDLVDIYPINHDRAIRISFFDDEIESINYFEPSTFRQQEGTDEFDVLCNTLLFVDASQKEKLISKVKSDLAKLTLKPEGMMRVTEIASSQMEYLESGVNVSNVFFLPYMDYFGASILDYLPNGANIIFDEPKLVQDKIKQIEDDNVSLFLDMTTKGEFLPKHMDFYFQKKNVLRLLSRFRLLAYTRLISQNKIFESDNVVNFICPHVDKYVGKYSSLASDAANYKKNGYTVVIVTNGDLNHNKIKNFFGQENLPFAEIEDISEAQENTINVLLSGPEYSCHFEMEKIIVFGSRAIGMAAVVNSQSSRSGAPQYLPQVGEYVVHEMHGIGKCIGIKNLKLGSVPRDYIVIEYAGGDILYLPSENADLISRYSGEQEPKCNKIGGAEFARVKQRVKSSIKEMAFDLIKVYSERLNSKGFVYSKDTYLQEAFEDAFSFDYTDDQLNAIRDIKADMESTRIMDRLVCGDVGFGKTEVALVAAFKAIQDGKQVAIICPTTILCEQHYSTAIERMKKFFVRVEAINRFKTKKQQQDILDRLKDGKIDLICGTHRLLSQDVKFKDLGLIIVDEEQRFGVEDKDKLKNIKKTVDVLSLSATPIPRTLYMSLSGMRDVSFLSTPPKERKRIKTAVIDYSDSLLVEACRRELERDGQVLIVYNRVESIASFYSHVKSLLPEANIGFAHGQMPSKMLEQAIYDLYSRKTNILISTVLIENGIDLPHANTLFVIDSDKLGLSQLYQLRGRIGRSDIEAYAYFSFKRNKTLTVDSYKRLDAIMEFSDFGSGYKIAMRDLEIRGAGDVLGKVQHGHMQQVGYEMYVKLLTEAVKELKGENVESYKEIKLDISLPAYVPDSYISSSESRISLYSSISKLKTMQELNAFLAKTKEVYSSIPKPVEQLCKVGLIKNLGQSIMAKQIVLNEFSAKVTFYNDVVSTPLYDYLSKGSSGFVLSEDKLPIITLKRTGDIPKDQDNLIAFLLDCQKVLGEQKK